MNPPNITPPPPTKGARSPAGLTVLCKGCKSWGLVCVPPRRSVDVCERVWWGQRRTLCSGRGQRPGAKLGTVSS